MSGEQAMPAAEQLKFAYKIGSYSALILGLGYLATIPVMTMYAGGFPPPEMEERLLFFAKHAAGWWTATALMVVTDLLYIPVFLAVYHSLKTYNAFLMQIAVACAGLFVFLDLAITWPSYTFLIQQGTHFVAATSDLERSAIIAAAGFPSSTTDSALLKIYLVPIPALAILFSSLVMLKGFYSKKVAYTGLIAGVCGILVGIDPLVIGNFEVVQYANASLVMVWFFMVGFRLHSAQRP